ncbi:MAG: YicC family protein [Alphaproteobacteria bacterium]|nr:YicC family protein [Alphaproteobacteria bacterium]
MNISSMTGFVRQDGSIRTSNGDFSFTFEIKSVNAKGLEIKTKLPPNFDNLEYEIKNKISQKFSRGTFNVLLNVKNQINQTDISINTALLDVLKNESMRLYFENPDAFTKPSPAELLRISGVVCSNEESVDEQTSTLVRQTVMQTLDTALDKLQADRRAEGEKIACALLSVLDEIDFKRQCAEQKAADIQNIIRIKISEQIASLLADTKITPERLEQEILFYVMRADTKEEFDRLKAHVLTARELFANGGVIGRRLDFLCQELNREANTLCSKSMDLELTKIGIDLKALIEQFREQIQNME